MQNAKVACVFVVMVLGMSALFIQPSQADQTKEEEAVKDKTLAFVNEVIGIDLSQYNITREGSTCTYEYDGQLKRSGASFNFESAFSSLSVSGIFYNEFIWWIYVDALNSPIIWAKQPSNNALVETRNILERYQNFSLQYGINASQVPQALNLLSNAPNASPYGSLTNFNGISDFTPANMTTENMRMSIKQDSISWEEIIDGFDIPNKGMSINIGYDTFIFTDLFNLYSVGCLSVVTEEEAKTLMFEAAKNYATTVQVGTTSGPVNITPNWTTVDIGFTMIPGRQFNNELNNALGDRGVNEGNATRDPLKLYPYWSATFYFEPISNHQGVQVQMWGDTKEIAYITLYSVRSNSLVPSTPTPEPTPTPTPISNPESIPSETPQPTKLPSTIWIFAVLATTFALTVATLLIKRKAIFSPKPLMV